MTIDHRSSKRAMAAAVALMVICASFIVVLSAPSAQAAFPALNQGDKWAVQGGKDISIVYSSDNDLFVLGNENAHFRNGTILGASLTGKVASAAVFEVLEVTGTQYVIRMTGGQELALAVKGMLEADMVLPGTYIEGWNIGSTNPDGLLNLSDAPDFRGEMGLDAKVAFGADEVITFTVQKSTMAIMSVEASVSLYVRGEAAVSNWPSTDGYYNSTTELDLIDVEYSTFDAKFSLDLNLSAVMEFEPYLAMIKSAPLPGEIWGEETYVNGTLEWDGMLDLTGLPAGVTADWFTPAMAEWGITGFPVDLAGIYNPTSSGPKIDNGTLALDAVSFDPSFKCNGYRTIEDPVYGTIEVFEVGMGSRMSFLYYPEKGYLVGTEVRLPYGEMITLTLSMESAPVDAAQKSVDTYADQVKKDASYDAVMSANTGAASSPIDLLLIVLLVVVVAVVAVAGFMLLRKRGPKVQP